MRDFTFHLDVSVDDETGKVRAAYVRVRPGGAAETREVVPGRAFADYDSAGHLVGVEFLAPCGAEVLDRITVDEPDPVKEFLWSSTPRQLVPA